MRRVSLCGIVAVLLPVAALAQGFPPDTGFDLTDGSFGRQAGGIPVLFAPLNAQGCYPSPVTSGSAIVTVTRASNQTINSGATTCAANELGIESSGASIWKGTTNYVLNSGTHPKAAEATASLGTGAYVGWHAGAGTMTIAAGTATVTGLSCTAVSPGTLCTFTVTVAGTMAVTTSAGTVTQAQIEAGTYATPYIATAGTATARAATYASVPLPALGDRFCVSVTAAPQQNWNAGAFRRVLSNSQGVSTNVFAMAINAPTQILWDTYDSAGGNRIVAWTHNYGANQTPHRFTGCYSTGTPTLCADGVAVGSVSGAGTGTMTATPTQMTLGGILSGSSTFDGNLSNLKICKGATKCGDCR